MNTQKFDLEKFLEERNEKQNKEYKKQAASDRRKHKKAYAFEYSTLVNIR